jgi:hypothetical protein
MGTAIVREVWRNPMFEPHNLELLKAMKKCVSSLEASGAIGPGDTTTNALMEALRIRIAELELHLKAALV